MTPLHIGLGAGAFVLLWAIVSFNTLVRARSKVDEAWSDVDVQLQRRHDLVPNLVEAVRAYAEHESSLFRELAESRAAAMSVHSCGRKEVAETDLARALTSLRTVSERYPALRASEHFRRLQSQLTEAETEIQAARRIYNTNVQKYNSRVQTFPASLIAGLAAFRSRRFFDLALMSQSAQPEAMYA
jgi:LemA protein